MRAFAPVMPVKAVWRLVDSDPALLAQNAGAGTTTHKVDMRNLDDLPLADARLVTASALLDLCSHDWVTRLALSLKDRNIAFYAALNYDGIMTWTPADEDDAVVTAAFNRHQRGDKGFGPALGPDCASAAADIFSKAGFSVTEAPSPWRLGPAQAELQRQLCDGIAAAAAEMDAATAGAWAARRAGLVLDGHCHIGHRDLLALPPGFQ